METSHDHDKDEGKGEDKDEGEDEGEGKPEAKVKLSLETTFGKPGEIVQEAVSGMDKVAGVSGEERRVPRARVMRSQDLEQPRPKKSPRVTESPTSTAPVHVSPAYGSEGPRESPTFEGPREREQHEHHD